MNYYFYILRCKDGSLYSGITNDLAKRLAAHNSGKGSKYVFSRGGGKFVYHKKLASRSAALKREATVKKLSRTAKENLIKKKPAGRLASKYTLGNV